MENRIHARKLNFMNHIVNLDDKELAKEIYIEQKRMKLPGLVKEVQELIKLYVLPDITNDNNTKLSKIAWKKIVKLAVHERVQNVLRDEINRYSKLRDGPMTTEDFELRQYIRNMNISDARVNFKYQIQNAES